MHRLITATAAALLVLLAAAGSRAVNLAPGDLVVVDIGTRVAVRVDPISGAQTLIADNGGGFDVAVAANGTIWASRSDHLKRIDPITGVRTVVADPLCAECTATGISIAPSGAIIVGTFGIGSAVMSVDPVTGDATLLASTGDLKGVAVDAGGDIFIAPELGQQIQRRDSTGALLRSYDLIGPPGQEFGRPEDIAFAPDGDLIILDGIRHVFVKLDVVSGAQTILDPLVFSHFPFGMAVEASGSFVFTAYADTPGSTGALWRFDPVTQTSSLITSGGFLSSGNGLMSVAVVPPAPAVPISSISSFLLVACLLALGTLLLGRHSRAAS